MKNRKKGTAAVIIGILLVIATAAAVIFVPRLTERKTEQAQP